MTSAPLLLSSGAQEHRGMEATQVRRRCWGDWSDDTLPSFTVINTDRCMLLMLALLTSLMPVSRSRDHSLYPPIRRDIIG